MIPSQIGGSTPLFKTLSYRRGCLQHLACTGRQWFPAGTPPPGGPVRASTGETPVRQDFLSGRINLFILIGIFLLQGCGQQNQKTKEAQETQPTEEKQVWVPDFNADSAYYFVEKQVAFGPRVPNTKAHRQCGDYLTAKLKEFGARVEEQTFEAEAFDGTKLNLRNIIGSFQPQQQKRILLAAHWDSRPFADKDTVDTDQPILGANDGASGVAVLLEIARVFSNDTLPEVGIDIIFFDGEDYGEPEAHKAVDESGNRVWWCLGSQYWAENKHKSNYSAYYGILLDMVGAENARFYREGVSMNNAPSVVNRVWEQAHALGYQRYFVYDKGDEIIDDHIYVNYKANIPMIDIIQYDPATIFGAYHHTHADNMEIISRATLEAVGETVLHVIYHE
jgi:glutaminyl-peptide cyclotransferase